MNKNELIQALDKRTDLSKHETREVLEIFVDSMIDAFVKGERVEIRGFCSFFIKKYEGYVGRNPKTGEKVQIPAKRLPFFKCGKDLKERVNY